MRDLTFVELFAGVGGLSMGLETAGWRCVGHAEYVEIARKRIAHWAAQTPDPDLFG